MNEYEQTFCELRDAGVEVDCDGEQSEEAICELETLLSYPLPSSYRQFVKLYGFGGLERNPYKGIVDNDPRKEVGESAYFQTLDLRAHWALPEQFLAIYYDYDLWLAMCIDLSSRDEDNECPIVVIEYRSGGELDVSIAGTSFSEVFNRHMRELISLQ